MIVLAQNYVQTNIHKTKIYNQTEVSMIPEPIEFSGTKDLGQIYQTTGSLFLLFLFINYIFARSLCRKQGEQRTTEERI
ncbi:hypothetical protein NUACC21_61250 [Scytonema sp. NUACC21]